MNEIFNENSHITDFGFNTLKKHNLTELEKLEIAEHLSYCDKCIEKYLEIMSQETLLTPPETFTSSTLKRIKRVAIKIFYNKYFSVSIAAGFAIFLWVGGFFNIDAERINKSFKIPEVNISISDSFFAKFNSVIDNLSFKYEDNRIGGNYEKK